MEKTNNYKDLKNLLYSGIICDVLDELGYRKQALGYKIRPICDDMVLLGKAFTAVGMEVFDMPEHPFKKQIETIDAISEDEIYTITTLGSYSAAFWGELLSTAVMIRKGVGALIDGMVRDSKKVREMGFPVFSKGFMPTTSKGRLEVVDYQIPIEIDGVRINPGDVIFGDVDGIVVIPKELEDEVFRISKEKAMQETNVRDRLLKGLSLAQVYKEDGIF